MKKIFFVLAVCLWVMAAANAFAGCVASCPEGTTDFNGFCYTESDGEITITDHLYSSEDQIIPSMINGKPVTSIGMGAFCYCINLTSVTIPASVTSIGVSAFVDCTSLAVAHFLGDAPNDEGICFIRNTPCFRVCHIVGAAGFDVEPWLSYNAQVCEQECEDDGACADDGLYCTGDPKCTGGVCGCTGNLCGETGNYCDEENDQCVECLQDKNCSVGYACVDGACVEDQPPEFLSEPLWTSSWMGLSSDPANPHKPQSQHILFWAYDDDRLACSGGVEVSWKYRPVALLDGEVGPLGDWVVKEPWRFLWFVWIETPGIADIAGPGLFEFKMTATDCLGQGSDSEGFWKKRYYFQVD